MGYRILGDNGKYTICLFVLFGILCLTVWTGSYNSIGSVMEKLLCILLIAGGFGLVLYCHSMHANLPLGWSSLLQGPISLNAEYYKNIDRKSDGSVPPSLCQKHKPT